MIISERTNVGSRLYGHQWGNKAARLVLLSGEPEFGRFRIRMDFCCSHFSVISACFSLQPNVSVLEPTCWFCFLAVKQMIVCVLQPDDHSAITKAKDSMKKISVSICSADSKYIMSDDKSNTRVMIPG